MTEEIIEQTSGGNAMGISDILTLISITINCIAIIVAPIISVRIAQKLQDKSRKHQDKIEILKTLMTSRLYGWTTQGVHALNVIDIVFSDDEEVRKQWKTYYDKLCVENPTETELKKIKIEQDKLIETIANSLGYKDKVSWETIQNPYIPKGMIDSMNQQQMLQAGQLNFLQMLSTSIPNDTNNNGGKQKNGQNENGKPKPDGRKHR